MTESFSIDWFAVSLRLCHPNWDPKDISSQLGMLPRVSWKAGDRRCTPKGQLLEGQYRSSYWCSSKLTGDWEKPSEALADHLDVLERKQAFIEKFIEGGGCVEFFLGWGLPGPSGGASLDAVLLKRLGDLGIDLSIDVYAQKIEDHGSQ
jgi:hypothetical protein